MRTRTPVPKREDLNQTWHLIDMEGQVLGRVAARVAMILQGKHRPTYTPHMDTGDFIVVINAEKAVLTGKKAEQRRYYWYTGYPGGLKSVSIEERMENKPEEVFRTAVRRMLPKTTLGRKMLKKLKICRGPDHPHQAQMPKLLDLQLRRAK